MQPILGITSLGKFIYQVTGAFQHQAQWSLHENMASILPLPIYCEQFASNTQPLMLAHLFRTIFLKLSHLRWPICWEQFASNTQPLMLAHLLGTISLKHSATAGPSVGNNFPQTQPLTLAHLLGTICPKLSHCWPICWEQFAPNTLILPPPIKPPSRCTCSITVFDSHAYPPPDMPVCVCIVFDSHAYPPPDMPVCVCIVFDSHAYPPPDMPVCVCIVFVKHPVLPPCAVDELSRNLFITTTKHTDTHSHVDPHTYSPAHSNAGSWHNFTST